MVGPDSGLDWVWGWRGVVEVGCRDGGVWGEWGVEMVGCGDGRELHDLTDFIASAL